jgi:hypothetical protein
VAHTLGRRELADMQLAAAASHGKKPLSQPLQDIGTWCASAVVLSVPRAAAAAAGMAAAASAAAEAAEMLAGAVDPTPLEYKGKCSGCGVGKMRGERDCFCGEPVYDCAGCTPRWLKCDGGHGFCEGCQQMHVKKVGKKKAIAICDCGFCNKCNDNCCKRHRRRKCSCYGKY